MNGENRRDQPGTFQAKFEQNSPKQKRIYRLKKNVGYVVTQRVKPPGFKLQQKKSAGQRVVLIRGFGNEPNIPKPAPMLNSVIVGQPDAVIPDIAGVAQRPINQKAEGK